MVSESVSNEILADRLVGFINNYSFSIFKYFYLFLTTCFGETQIKSYININKKLIGAGKFLNVIYRFGPYPKQVV